VTKPKRWPRNAEWARLDAIAKAEEGLLQAEPALRGEVQDPAGLMRIIALLVHVLHQIIAILRGAKEGKDA